jgi:hypothetical protein
MMTVEFVPVCANCGCDGHGLTCPTPGCLCHDYEYGGSATRYLGTRIAVLTVVMFYLGLLCAMTLHTVTEAVSR